MVVNHRGGLLCIRRLLLVHRRRVRSCVEILYRHLSDRPWECEAASATVTNHVTCDAKLDASGDAQSGGGKGNHEVHGSTHGSKCGICCCQADEDDHGQPSRPPPHIPEHNRATPSLRGHRSKRQEGGDHG